MSDQLKQIDDGGPAFPRTGREMLSQPQSGVSLRDWFSGIALQGLLADELPLDGQGKMAPKKVKKTYAAIAYEYADAMIVARAKGQS